MKMKILLTTLHAKYSHASLSLPCLATCCRDLPGVSITIREYTVNEPREHLLRLIMSEQADLVAFSCYIWNIEKTLGIVSDIKKIAPETRVVLGGPEVSFGTFELMHNHPAVDFVIKGEGEAVFRRLAEALTDQGTVMFAGTALEEIDNLFFREGIDISAGPPTKGYLQLDSIPSPFEAGLVDLNKPLTYYETSRGCPFSCAFCLSSVEGQVRSYSMERIRHDLLLLMQKKVPQIKLVDRTFNYDGRRADDIWRFILKHNQGSHFHFEIAADLLSDSSLNILKLVPADTFRFEIGVQSASADTLKQVNRTADLGRIFYCIRRLRAETKIDLHLDLVAGLPGENYAAFLASLQAVADLHPHQIQVEPLKVLKGSPMREIAAREDYCFSESPPYAILRNPWLSYDDICRIETIGRLLDLFYNHRGFGTVLELLTSSTPLSALLGRMAANAADQALSGLSSLRLYELFFRLASPGLDSADNGLFADALFFDFCCSEMPRQGKLPMFIAERSQACSWPGGRELTAGTDLPSGSRVKAFRFLFKRDYRISPCREATVEITFLYVSGARQGLKVIAL
jgi:anaerobic magnesium-protoporphyrin IX monomethyl ester cyclase